MAIFLQLVFAFLVPLVFNGSPLKTASPHPFFVSVTEITQHSAGKSLEVSCKFFVDDFEETMKKAYKQPLDITSAKEKATFDKLIPDYIGKHLSLTLDGRAVQLSYVGYEIDKESVYCYFETLNVSSVKQLHISNSLLHDFKTEQINIIHVTINGKRQSIKLSYPSSTADFRF